MHAVYGNFPYVLAFVILLTFVLLMRAFRSVFLPLKAVILNLISLAAAFGIIVLIFQQGHGAEAIWNIHATDAIISWIPLMIFAFLYGLSMDYEVFMLSRMREAYDETGDTKSRSRSAWPGPASSSRAPPSSSPSPSSCSPPAPAPTSSSSGSGSRPASSSTPPSSGRSSSPRSCPWPGAGTGGCPRPLLACRARAAAPGCPVGGLSAAVGAQ